MTTDDLLDHDDVGEALAEDRELRPARAYRFKYAHGDLNFRPVAVVDPVPLGRQILAAGGDEPNAACSLFAILANGDFEDVRLDEPFDLRAKGAERFIAFKTDRTFKLTLNESVLFWGAPAMNGGILYALADKSPDDGVFLRVPGGADRLIERDEVIDLTAPGVERFVTAPLRYEIIVNARPHVVVGGRVTFEQVVELAFPGSQSEPNTSFSMTYRRAASTPHAGELAAGGSVHVQNGTIFNVTKTVQS